MIKATGTEAKLGEKSRQTYVHVGADLASKFVTVLDRRELRLAHFWRANPSMIQPLRRAAQSVRICAVICFLVCCTSVGASSDANLIHHTYVKGDFKLVQRSELADVVVSVNDFKVVQIAAQNLADDIRRVTGKKAELRTDLSNASRHAVIVGTLGQSPLIDELVHAGKLQIDELRGQWESFVITTVTHPFPNVEMGLVIIGSDRRGSAYGVFELSEAIGVSPWYWWADVPPTHYSNLFVSATTRRAGPPSVQYRGIFLNDEDYGLQPWAAKTFDPQLGDIGPKTYARIFELLLRLKANTLWPAMHSCTKAFNLYPDNKRVAEDYGIVVGSSHAEPMLRNNVTEWTDKPENYDYTKNRAGVLRYWEERVEQNGRYENVYTIGMRGIHDSPIVGPKTQGERIPILQNIFADQRSLLEKHVDADATRVPQIFCPYKEVLADYRSGLKVPDDVTIVFPDDNFGYIRYFPSVEELKRKGGFGVYYHASYLGSPLSYLWLDSTPPPLIWEEMSKAYDHGMRKFWMLNVGDLKPAEISIEFFMQMAWDISRWRRENLSQFLVQWATAKFGIGRAAEIAAVMTDYYNLGFARRPEHLQWNFANEKPGLSKLTSFDYGDEVQRRLDAYESLLTRANRLYEQTPQVQRDALYELVVYPVRGAALANRRYFAYQKSTEYLAQGRASASAWARKANDAEAQMNAETDYYNQKLAGGKWRHMMSIEPPAGQWQNMRMTRPVAPAELAQTVVPEKAGLGVAIEGRASALGENETDQSLPALNRFTREPRFIDVFNTGKAPATWTAKSSNNWIKLDNVKGNLSQDSRIVVTVDWNNAPREENVSGTVEIVGAGSTRIVRVPIFNPKLPPLRLRPDFVEVNRVVSIEAEHLSKQIDRGGRGWRIIGGLGRTGDSVTVFPTTTASIDTARIVSDAPVLEYSLQIFSVGKYVITCYVVPTHPIQAGRALRYAIGFDNQPPQVVTVGADLVVPSRQWSLNVLNASATTNSIHEVTAAGPHVLKLYMIDAGIVVDKIVLESGGLRPSYLGPPETRRRF
ncbi:MAG TPA: glycosyl hydrolase 115 family protein [Pyrinomonadaceae bacterium]|nr:glycosyl hydrolase 115 family protein [Pyrinomonadaceae bacterium]